MQDLFLPEAHLRAIFSPDYCIALVEFWGIFQSVFLAQQTRNTPNKSTTNPVSEGIHCQESVSMYLV